MTGLAGYLVDAGPPAKADLIVVLAGDMRGNRMLKAGELIRQGYATQALVSGPACCYGRHESDLAIRFAVDHGYPESYFVAFPNDTFSTVEEARVIVPELRKRSVHSIDLVTSDYHTRRSARIYRALAPDLQIHVVAAPDLYFTPGGWWKNREGKKTFLTEWLKTAANWFGM